MGSPGCGRREKRGMNFIGGKRAERTPWFKFRDLFHEVISSAGRNKL